VLDVDANAVGTVHDLVERVLEVAVGGIGRFAPVSLGLGVGG
jgi:hypothetical protein